ncbi:MAG TPA: methyltransferase domain-containing protein [Thermomicrobiales bacterium]|nr:methyltransferase domain-containing protein [Thermomicrobiales bacterium]
MHRLRRIAQDRSPSDLQRITSIYDQHAPRWDEIEGRGEGRVVGDFRDRLAGVLQGDVLEIGIGTGATLRHLTESSSSITSYTGIDLSAGMLAEAEKLVPGSPFPVTLRQMNAEDLSAFPDETFDTVTASLVLCTVPDAEAALREMARVVKPDGRIVLIEHVLAPNPVIAAGMKVVAPLQRRHMACNIDRRTDRLVREMGFRVERDDARFLGIVHLIVARPPEP